MQCIIARDGVCVSVSETKPVAGSGEVLVQVVYSAVNRADTLQRQYVLAVIAGCILNSDRGKYQPPAGSTPILGLEMVGKVVAIGEGCSRSDISVGTTVMGVRRSLVRPTCDS